MLNDSYSGHSIERLTHEFNMMNGGMNGDLRMPHHPHFPPLNIKTEAMEMMSLQQQSMAGGLMAHMPHGCQPGYQPMPGPGPGMGMASPNMDHLSPPMAMDTTDISKGGRIRKVKEDKYCGVCGDRALGYNFDAISCESCKAFFRRNALKGLDYFKCPYDEKCKMDISNRRFCKRCRLKKCFEIGMRKEYILTDEEKMRKRQKIEENRFVRPGVVKEFEKVAPLPAVTSPRMQNAEVTSSNHMALAPRPLTGEEQDVIIDIVSAYKTSLEISIDGPDRDKSNCMADLVNIAELSVRRVIDMSKKIKTFKTLSQADQISLLKGGSIELLILRSVISYDKEKGTFLDATDNEETCSMTPEQLRKTEWGLFDDHMKFVRSLAIDLKADETTLILLLVISLFSPDRPNLLDKNSVCFEQERYSLLLKAYLESMYPPHVARSMYPKLLMKLVDIRNLNEEHSAVLVKVNPEGIQPLMIELLDLRQ